MSKGVLRVRSYEDCAFLMHGVLIDLMHVVPSMVLLFLRLMRFLRKC
jgi:hypothetical protein